MKKIYFIFLMLLFVFSSFAENWKSDEWLLTEPLFLPPPLQEEIHNNKSLYPESFHKRIFKKISKCPKVSSGLEVITFWGTTKWGKVESVGECPKIKEPMPECSIFFAAKYWISSEEQKAELRFGSDDAAKVWLNGRKVFQYSKGRTYKPDKSIVSVTIKKGTNIFAFAVINGEDIGMIGARLYPKKSAIYPGLFLDTKNFVEKEKFVKLNFYWMPYAIVKPRKRKYKNPPKCGNIRLLDFEDNVLTQITKIARAGKRSSLGKCRLLDMRGKSNGIYKIESYWNGEKHIRPFYYAGFPKKLTPTEKWKQELLKHNDFFSPKALLYETFGKHNNTKKIYAYKSKFDNTLQPYIVMLPQTTNFNIQSPLRVNLRADTRWNKIEFIKRIAYNQTEMIDLWVYARGDSGFTGISERDVLEVIELVCEEYKIDRNKIYLRGFSLGAAGCWWIGGRHPELFAAVSPNSDYDFQYADNFQTLPVWQFWWKPFFPGYSLSEVLNNLRYNGAEVLYNDMRVSTPKQRKNILEKIEKWFLSKKRNTQPMKVAYSTYGDIDGAYWVRNIMPERFGKKASVVPEVKVFSNQCSVIGGKTKYKVQNPKHGLIHIQTENVSSFSLDLKKGRFLEYKNWKIVIDDFIVTNCVSGKMFSYNNTPCPKGHHSRERIKKSNGFCGGIADVVYDSFLFAYNADDIKSKMRAIKFNMAITGIRPYQFDGNFKVVPDTKLTPELCEKYNVILFVSLEKPGKFIKENIEKLPFEILNGKLEFKHTNISTSSTTAAIYKQDACVTFPNPIASNRYLLTVTMTNFTPRILMSERNDIILDGKRGSFDINWDKVQWQEEHKKHSCETKSKEPRWKEVGGIIFLMIFGGMGLYLYLKK